MISSVSMEQPRKTSPKSFWLSAFVGALAAALIYSLLQALWRAFPGGGRYAMLSVATLLLAAFFAMALRWAWRTR
jgi:hypothetical protein